VYYPMLMAFPMVTIAVVTRALVVRYYLGSSLPAQLRIMHLGGSKRGEARLAADCSMRSGV